MSSLVDLWPLYGLVIETPRLRLQLPRESDLVGLARAARSIQPAGQPTFQLPWMYAPSPHMERALLQRHWRALAHWRPESWHLLLAIHLDGQPIGIQELWATDYPVTRAAGIGSWLNLDYQGRGLGREALTAVSALAFDGLGAGEVQLEYLDGNLAAGAIADRLGFVPSGQRLVERDGPVRRIEHQRRLVRDAWVARSTRSTIAVQGLEGCESLFGAQVRAGDR